MIHFQYIIELSEPINVLSELSLIQHETQKILVRENGEKKWNKNEYTNKIIIFDSSKNELDNHEERFMQTDLFEIYSKTNNFSITGRITELLEISENKRKSIREAFNRLKNNINIHSLKQQHDALADTHPYFEKTTTDLRNMFKTKFSDQYTFTGYEMHIINKIINNEYVKNKIKNMRWVEVIH